jgi:hypothetical protein
MVASLKGRQQMFWRAISTASAAVFFACGVQAATLVPLANNPGGQPAEISVRQWTEWALSFDLERDEGDPIFDETGEFQTLNQDYPVYMVGGANSENVERTFTAPPGRPFLIPMLNTFCLGDPDRPIGGCEGPDFYDFDRERDVDLLFLRVDGERFVNAGSQSEVAAIRDSFFVDGGIFPIDVSENNLFNRFVDVEGGPWPESYNVGYFATLELPLGNYLIEYGGRYGDGFANSVTVRMSVVPLPGALPLITGGILMLAWTARRRRPESR